MYRSIANTDFADNVRVHPRFYSAEDVDALYARAAAAGFWAMNWRVQNTSRMFCRSALMPTAVDKLSHDQSPVYRQVLDSYDPPRAAVEAGRRHGVKTFLWFTPVDCHYDVYVGGAKTQLDPVAPYFMRSRDGLKAYEGIPSPAYPECRQVWAAFARELMESYEPDGLFVSFRTHAGHPDGRGSAWPPFEPNSYGFDPPAVELYRERTGRDPFAQELDLDAWARVQGEFRTLLLADIRAAAGDARLCADVGNLRVQLTSHDDKDRINSACPVYNDWETWLRDGSLDGVCVHSPRQYEDCSFLAPEFRRWPKQDQIAVWMNITVAREVDGGRVPHIRNESECQGMAAAMTAASVPEVFWHETACFDYRRNGVGGDPHRATAEEKCAIELRANAEMWDILAGK